MQKFFRGVFSVGVVALPMMLLAQAAQAITISQTAAQLNANGDVTFPTIAPTGLPNALTFGDGSVNNEVLLRWDVFGAGTIGATDPTANIRITATIQRLRNTAGNLDWDPVMALWDGTNILGGLYANNDGGSYLAQFADATSDGQTTSFNGFTSQIVGGAPGVNELVDLVLDLTLTPGQGSLTMSGFNGSLSTGPFTFDRSNELSLLISRSNSNEVVSVQNIEVDLTFQAVPEPGALALLGLGFAGLGIARRRRSVSLTAKPCAGSSKGIV